MIRKLREQLSVLRSVATKSEELMINQWNNLLKDFMASPFNSKWKALKRCSLLPAGLMQETDRVITVLFTAEFKLSLNCQLHQKKIKNT